MKKSYISPESEMINLVTENMIAASLQVQPGHADQWSHKRGGWNSDDWSGVENEETDEFEV